MNAFWAWNFLEKYGCQVNIGESILMISKYPLINMGLVMPGNAVVY